MNTIIKHMVEISCHRDHALLDVSILSAIDELSGASQARVFGIYSQNGEMLIRPRAWLAQGRITSVEQEEMVAPPDELTTSFPVLMLCLHEHQPRAQELTKSGEHKLWLPVWLNDKVSTCIEITHSTPYSAQTLDLVDGILSVYRNFQSLLDYSERDSLTGLLNRKTFDSHFLKMQAVVARHAYAPPVQDERRLPDATPEEAMHHWLAVVDIDHFKRVNDQFGHLYGDEVLILVANLMQLSFRATDRIFRFGGEEFVILLSAISFEQATGIIERFRVAIENHLFPQIGHITVSLGFTAIQPFETPVAVVGHADQALYYAKSNGRNQACHYETLVSSGLLQAAAISNDTAEFF